jgi:hypothetical protein
VRAFDTDASRPPNSSATDSAEPHLPGAAVSGPTLVSRPQSRGWVTAP